MENINALELFKEGLDTDDIASRVNTIHKVSIVATLMSADAIKTTLLPFLDALSKKEDDEVVFAITDEYATLAYMVPHSAQCLETSTLWCCPTCRRCARTTRR
jgi:hypothetical protein